LGGRCFCYDAYTAPIDRSSIRLRRYFRTLVRSQRAASFAVDRKRGVDAAQREKPDIVLMDISPSGPRQQSRERLVSMPVGCVFQGGALPRYPRRQRRLRSRPATPPTASRRTSGGPAFGKTNRRTTVRLAWDWCAFRAPPAKPLQLVPVAPGAFFGAPCLPQALPLCAALTPWHPVLSAWAPLAQACVCNSTFTPAAARETHRTAGKWCRCCSFG
jgi:hypothetical protein